MNNRKFFISSILLLGTIGISCHSSREELRSIVQDELSRQSEVEFFSSEKVIGPYSPAVRAGKFLFLSGQIGLDPQTMTLVGDDIESQTRQVFTNITAILQQHRGDVKNIVQSTVYLKDMNEFARMNQIYSSLFTNGRYPTRTTVEVSQLPKGAKIEIAVVAYLPQQ
jgi:2-iminobutanoate/2-iminopropanoate deaminase